MKTRLFTLMLIAALAISVLTGCQSTENTLQSAGRTAADSVDAAGQAVQESPAAATAPATAPTQAAAAALTQAEAEELALNHAGLTLGDVRNLHSHYEIDDGVPEYDIDFRSGDYDYDYTVHAETGKILSHDKEYEPEKSAATEASAAAAAAPALTAEEAKAIALEHALLTADQVTHLRAEYEIDRGIPHYDVEFDQGRFEYDYEIHAETGEILSFEKDD